ncbi:CAP domain-containing protein [Oceanobacillus sp. Castelsardo]|uniref:CAP domain-containing protein n=1 Tax=Oceanobacillus sp. Castelsardo TaxID=1851204 RepID=UPI0008393B51|nr:CAP domain-containing protein [Oceanobacillus sp. Castelsardo]
MRVLKGMLIISVLVLFIIFFVKPYDISNQKRDLVSEYSSKIVELKSKSNLENYFKKNMTRWIGQSKSELLNEFGEPERKDPSAYGYEWWVYQKGYSDYLQFGILNEEIITVYVIGNQLEYDSISIGESYKELSSKYDFANEVEYNESMSSYTFRLTEEDLKTRPLIKLSSDTFMQLYFDTFTEELSSIRILAANVLLMHQPYEIVYRGSLPEAPKLDEQQWEEVESGMEKQIFDITNVMRVRQGSKPLEWEHTVRDVAYDHSKDMAENNYFSHFGLDGEGLKERLADKEVFYLSAGENIAAQYTDAPAAMEGWLNSKGHREALLSDDYTHIGVGVYRLYYTQNFLAQAS